MKRFLPIAACLAGLIALLLLMPRFAPAQPEGIRITRGEAVTLADKAARELGIPVDKAWSSLTWSGSALLDKEFETKPELRGKAFGDPVIGPRLGGYQRSYYRRGLEKFPPYGVVAVDAHSGAVVYARRRLRNEQAGAQKTEAQLRPLADAFVRTHPIDGAPSPQFESARPTSLRTRTDWTFRYRVPTKFPIGNVVPYLYVYYNGDQFGGWALVEEYADGSNFRSDTSEVGGILVRYAANFALLLILLIIFLKKYHAGEVGIGTGSVLLAVVAVLSLVIDYVLGPGGAEGSQTGGLDAQQTAITYMSFKFLLYDLVLAVLVFFAWSVGESFARERWGERLASFDAILRRDLFNATVGRSLLRGALLAPALAAAAFLTALIPLRLGTAHLGQGIGTDSIVQLGGPLLALLFSLIDAIWFPLVALVLLAWAHRKRLLPAGVAAVIAVGMAGGIFGMPIEPFTQRLLFGFGGIVATIAVFMGYDLLTTAVALFGGTLLSMVMPLLYVSRGHEQVQLIALVGGPLAVIVTAGIAALLTRREVVYAYEDLAPHVKRIVERERVKAEIDAANRIQAALLPLESPRLAGASVASHYLAATEIGGDYFDFLTQPTGEIGIAFGDVSGHGLSSGIVMAMAKSALLVQVDYDASPRAVLTVLNEIVMKTAPKRILMTFFFGLLDPRTQTLRFSSAGHLDPYVYRAATGKVEALSSWGFPLGVKRREPFREHSVEFAPGDRLVLYSDGLIEAIDDDGEPYGFERFEKMLAGAGHLSADDIKKTVLAALKKFTRNRPPEDDQTLVVVGFDDAGVEQVRPPVVDAYLEHVN
jgi:serine phosphatase RsbU (regulator of sigma subunit)